MVNWTLNAVVVYLAESLFWKFMCHKSYVYPHISQSKILRQRHGFRSLNRLSGQLFWRCLPIFDNSIRHSKSYNSTDTEI